MLVSPLIGTAAYAQGQLSNAEIESALAGNGADRWITLTDNRLVIAAALSGSYGNLAQAPTITILTPQAIIAQRSRLARKQYLTYQPSADDTQRAITIVAEGIAVGSSAGPRCSSIARVALLSDKAGRIVQEAESAETNYGEWQNGFGATSDCQCLKARFSLWKVQRVQANAANGEFLVAVFYENVPDPRLFKVKKRYLRRLGID
jgi:hypothetical protein